MIPQVVNNEDELCERLARLFSSEGTAVIATEPQDANALLWEAKRLGEDATRAEGQWRDPQTEELLHEPCVVIRESSLTDALILARDHNQQAILYGGRIVSVTGITINERLHFAAARAGHHNASEWTRIRVGQDLYDVVGRPK